MCSQQIEIDTSIHICKEYILDTHMEQTSQINLIKLMTDLLKCHSLFILTGLRKIFETEMICVEKEDGYIRTSTANIRKNPLKKKQWEILLLPRAQWIEMLCNKIISCTYHVLNNSTKDVYIRDFSWVLFEHCLMWIYLYPDIIRNQDLSYGIAMIKECLNEFISINLARDFISETTRPPAIHTEKKLMDNIPNQICMQVEIPFHNTDKNLS